MKYAISACLCGVNCKYNGKNNFDEKFKKLYDEKEAILICPEVLGGLPIPRTPFEIRNNKAITKDNLDITKNVIDGANKALLIMQENGVIKAILKESSPSCGVKFIYDGTFTKTKINGMGIAATIFKDNGIEVISSEDYYEEK